MSATAKRSGRRGSPLRWALVSVAILLVLTLLGLGAVAWVGSERALNPTLREPAQTLVDFPDLSAEEISFASRTGVTLSGRFFAGTGGATIILCHGFTGRQDDLLPLVATLNGAGFNVLTYNSRHPLEGEGVYTTFGVLEQHDLMSAVDYVSDRPDIDPNRIGVYGLSLGAATVILAAAQDERIRATVAEAGYSDADNVIADSYERYIGLPAFPFAPVTRMVAEWRTGLRMKDAQPIDYIGAMSPRPILLIHGLADESIPPDHTERLYGAAAEPKTLWLVPDAGHGAVQSTAGEVYDTLVLTFFDQWLRRWHPW
jgi:uncharacterized protein